MKIATTYSDNRKKVHSIIEYDEDECAFIENLPPQAQRNILRGMCTPYDYGYKKDR